MRILTELELIWLQCLNNTKTNNSNIEPSNFRREFIDHKFNVRINCCNDCEKALLAINNLFALGLIFSKQAQNCVLYYITERGKKELELQLLARLTSKTLGNAKAA